MGAALLSLAWSLATSRPGLIAIAGALGLWAGYHRGGDSCDARQAAAQAAQMRAQLAETARQAKAAAAIAANDLRRVAQKADAAAAMQAEIDRLQSELAQKGAEHAPAPGNRRGAPGAGIADRCAIDGDFARRVRQLDAAGKR
jgi:multidrug resistance efflux pump